MRKIIFICILPFVFSSCYIKTVENIYVDESSQELRKGIINDEYGQVGIYPKQFEDICTGKMDMSCEDAFSFGLLCAIKINCNDKERGVLFYKNSTEIINYLKEGKFSEIVKILNGEKDNNVSDFWNYSLFGGLIGAASKVLHARELDNGIAILSCSGNSGSCTYQLGYFYVQDGEIKYPIVFLDSAISDFSASKIDIMTHMFKQTNEKMYELCGRDEFNCGDYGKRADEYFINWFQSLPASKLKEYVYGIKK